MWWNRASIRRLRMMMESIRSRDFTLHYSLNHLRGEERLLAEEINKVIGEFRETQQRQEAMYGQFESLLDLVDAALIVAGNTGRVMWMNKRAINDLCGFRIETLESLSVLRSDLPAILDSIKAGEHRLVRFNLRGREAECNVTMTSYYRQGDMLRLFSIENLRTVLQQHEVEAQRRLVSVLTHEIMNSLAPIISLSESLMDMATGDDQQALAAIHRRSQGLLDFVDNYRQLSRIPSPHKALVKVCDLIVDIQSLFTSQHIIYNIEDAAQELDIDRQQMEQVIINLLKNADEAGGDIVTLATQADRASMCYKITVTDNGRGILPDVLERIFVPFFTTKPGGSGIGLSICRQIVVQHGGTISVESRSGHTTFSVILPLP